MLPAISNAFVAFSIVSHRPFYIVDIDDISFIDDIMLINPMNTSGTIKYPTNNPTIGANPITFPIIPFTERPKP